MSDEEVKSVIREAIDYLDDFESDAACARIRVLLGQKDRVDMVQKLYTALEYIDDFECKEATEILKTLV